MSIQSLENVVVGGPLSVRCVCEAGHIRLLLLLANPRAFHSAWIVRGQRVQQVRCGVSRWDVVRFGFCGTMSEKSRLPGAVVISFDVKDGPADEFFYDEVVLVYRDGSEVKLCTYEDSKE